MSICGRRRIRVRIKGRVLYARAASPESRTTDLVRVGLAHHRRRHPGNAARERRRSPPRETRHGQIEAAPEKMHGARLADESCAKALEHAVGAAQCAEEPLGLLRIVSSVSEIGAE